MEKAAAKMDYITAHKLKKQLLALQEGYEERLDKVPNA